MCAGFAAASPLIADTSTSAPLKGRSERCSFFRFFAFRRLLLKPAHIEQIVFETRCRGAILHASLAENVLSGDKSRRYVSRNPATRRVLLSLLYVCPGRNCWKKVRRKLLTYRRLLSTTASFSARWGEGKSPMAFPKRSDRRGSGSCGKRAPDWEAPASSLLRPRTSSLRSRLPRCGPMQAVFCPLSRCCRAVPRRLLACRLSRTRRA